MLWLKRLAFILWLAFCIGLGFLITLISRRVCFTKACFKKANLIVYDMDLSYSKCENFYKSICGKYGHRKRGDLTVNSIWEEIKRREVRRLNKFLEEPMIKDDDRVLRILKKIYRSCLNTMKIEKEGIQPLKNLIHLAGGFPLVEGCKWTTNFTEENWILGLAEYNIKEAGFSGGHIFRSYIEMVGKDHFVHLSPPKYSELYGSHFNHYFTYVKNITLSLNNNSYNESLEKEINETLHFGREIAKIAKGKQNCSRAVERETIQSVIYEFPFLHLDEFLGNMSITGEGVKEVAFVGSSDVGKEYLKALKTLYEKTPRRIVANYMVIENIVEVTPMLPSSFRAAYYELMRKTKGPKFKKGIPRKILCTQCLKDKMVSAFSALYLKKHFKKFEHQEFLSNIVLTLKNQMKKLVDGVKWMDGETKKKALWKIDELDFAAPVPKDVFEEITDKKKFRVYYESLCFTGNISDSLTAYVSLQQFHSDKNWELLTRPIESFDKNIDIFTGEIKFDYERNVVVIPMGFLNYPSFDDDWPNYLNYGGFCSKLAMELIRGVDFEGKNYDPKGNLDDWWSTETKSKYDPESKCFINKYNHYLSSYCNTKIQDPKCILDDIAALAGIEAAFMAYKDYSQKRFFKERQMPKLKDFSPEQMFFVDFATFYCHDNNTAYYNGMTELEASKSYNEYKVNGPLRNFHSFAQVFGCSNNDSMNPHTKCNIWGNRKSSK